MIFKYSYWEIIHYAIPILQVFLLIYAKKYLLALCEIVILQWFIFYNDCSLVFVILNQLQSGQNLITMDKPYLDFLSPIYHFGLIFISFMALKQYLKERSIFIILICTFLLSYKHLPFKFFKLINKTKYRYICYFILAFISFSNSKYNLIELNLINLFLITFSILISYLLDFKHILNEMPILFAINLIIILFLFYNINKRRKHDINKTKKKLDYRK